MRINEIKIEHIDTNNQLDVIKYLQNVNASFHSSLIIKKMSWSFRVIRDKKRYFTLHMKIIIVEMINRMLFENLMKIFEIKKCERFIKNCTLRQCLNCQKYEHKRNIVESSLYAKNASWDITLTNAIHRSLKSIKCAKRAKIVNTSHDRRSAECVEKKSRRQNVLDKFACNYISRTNRKSLSACFDSSSTRQQHRSRFRSRTRKSFFRNEK
jgi:hypothetical protein